MSNYVFLILLSCWTRIYNVVVLLILHVQRTANEHDCLILVTSASFKLGSVMHLVDNPIFYDATILREKQNDSLS